MFFQSYRFLKKGVLAHLFSLALCCHSLRKLLSYRIFFACLKVLVTHSAMHFILSFYYVLTGIHVAYAAVKVQLWYLYCNRGLDPPSTRIFAACQRDVRVYLMSKSGDMLTHIAGIPWIICLV